MCLRPDITYVVAAAVFADYQHLQERGVLAGTVGFFDECDTAITGALANGNEDSAEHWRQVKDFGTRTHCSPLSGVEVNGERVNPVFHEVPEQHTVRLYIGNPANPQHVPGQADVTAESMARVNAGIRAYWR